MIERQQRKAATTEELLRSWETAEHVNNITRLKEMGSDAMLSYARDAIPSDDVLRRAPALPPTRQLAATINAARTAARHRSSGFRRPRAGTQGATPAVDVSTVDGAFLLLCLGSYAVAPSVISEARSRRLCYAARVRGLVGAPRGDGVFMACFQDKLFRGPPYAIAAEDKVKTIKLARPCGSSRTRPRRRPRAALC